MSRLVLPSQNRKMAATTPRDGMGRSGSARPPSCRYAAGEEARRSSGGRGARSTRARRGRFQDPSHPLAEREEYETQNSSAEATSRKTSRGHVAHRVPGLKAVPVERNTNHWPAALRAARSALPSPL